METIRVKLAKKIDNSYNILIGEDVFSKIATDLNDQTLAHSYAVVTDSNVNRLYGKRLEDEIRKFTRNVIVIEFEAGEKNKNREIKSFVEDGMLNSKFGRDSAVIALGGGVVGDLAGYVAATYTRGIPYIQVATTLVAAVDSSIGGKTAVDTPQGKNLIGCFHQPKAVYIDLNTLKTLEQKEIREGLAEVIKYGVIADRELFEIVENGIDEIFNKNSSTLKEIIERSCIIKAKVVEKDEKEENLRKILNFGHTIGHAIEKLSDYSLSHGNAISIGMAVEGKIAEIMGLWQADELISLKKLLSKSGLPVELPGSINKSEMINTMKLDKKTRAGNIEMSIPSSIGSMAKQGDSYAIKIDENIINDALK